MERETRFELATSTLARSHSTTELLPRTHKDSTDCRFVVKLVVCLIRFYPRKSAADCFKSPPEGGTLNAHLVKGLLEAAIGIEPMNKGFADLCLTTWLRRRQEDKG